MAEREIVLQGIVVPARWDQEGNAIALAVSATDETEYMVKDDAMGKSLYKHLRRRVKVRGVKIESPDGNLIAITNYVLTDERK